MDTPEVQYAQTSDGVRIAYSVAGSGKVVLWVMEPPMSHAEAIWGITNPYREALVNTNTVAMVDTRGFGLSDRDAGRFSVETFERDIDAVAAKLAASKFELVAVGLATKPALAYAATNPERVGLLTLVNPPAMAPGLSVTSTRVARLFGNMLLSDWDLFSETLAGSQFGWDDARRERAAQLIRLSTTAEGLRHFAAFTASLDLRPHLASVRCPCLVIHLEGSTNRPEDSENDIREQARELAAALPNATFRSVSYHAVEGGNPIPVARAPAVATSGGTVTILFLDIVDSTPLTERQGDAAFRAQSRELDSTLRRLLREHGGSTVEGKVLGDGVLATFASASKAIEAALACNEATTKTDLRLHLGLHAGDVIDEGDNVYGGAVNLAARVCQRSEPGEVLVSETVRALARTSAAVRFLDRGLHELKGINEPQRLFAVASVR